MSVPTGDTDGRYRIVCDSHGVLPEECADEIAAGLVAREHREDCGASSEVLSPEQFEGFTRASEMERNPGQEGYWEELDGEAGAE